MLKIRTVACLIKVINNLSTLYQQSKESINTLLTIYKHSPRPRSRTSQDRPPFSSENLIRAPVGMSRLNDLTYYRSLLCLEELHFRFYLSVRDGTAPTFSRFKTWRVNFYTNGHLESKKVPSAGLEPAAS